MLTQPVKTTDLSQQFRTAMFLVVLTLTSASAQTYYVDFGTIGAAASTGNILNWNNNSTNPNGALNLIRFDTGAPSTILLTAAGFGATGNAGDGSATVTGGQALTYLSPVGMNLLGSINGLAGTTSTLTISGLDYLNFTYELTITGNRNNATARNDVIVLSDVSLYSNVSDGTISTTTTANDTTTFIVGANNAGISARFTSLDPGTDNDLRVTINTTLTGASDRYYIGALNLTAIPVPEPSTIALAGLGIAGLLALRRRY